MKIVRGFLNFDLCVLLLIPIIALSFVYRAKSFVEKEVLISFVKEGIVQGINSGDLTDEEKSFVDKIIKDKTSETIIKKIFQNYITYTKEDNYSLEKDDYNLLLDFILKYQNEMNTLSETNYSEQEIRDLLNYDDVNKMAKETFDDIDSSVKFDDFSKITDIYNKITSVNLKIALFLCIIVLVLLICLVNWSLIKWLVLMGIDLLISGFLFITIYGMGLLTQNLIKADETVMALIKSIKFNGFLVMGIVEFIVGILMIVGYKLLKKRMNQNGREA